MGLTGKHVETEAPSWLRVSMAVKLWALGRLVVLMGMKDFSRFASTPGMERERFLARLREPGVLLEQKQACAMLLDLIYGKEWRTEFQNEAGYVADRSDHEVREWRMHVLARDGRACRNCGSKRSLHAHHIVRWADAPTLRLVVANGITLCRGCHNDHHGGANLACLAEHAA